MTRLKPDSRPAILLLILIAIAFYATSVRDGHNWGGDFSQYILHAKNLLHGAEYTELGYVYKKEAPIGPRAYPPAYPLSIVPVLYLFGLNFVALKLELLLFLALALYVYARLARAYLPASWALGCLAFLAFTPWILKFSNNVLSDIPYLALSLTAVWAAYRFLQSPPTAANTACVILAMALACGFRTAGLVLIGTLAAYTLIFRRSHLVHALLATGGACLAVFFTYHVFNCGSTYVEQPSFHPADLFNNLKINLSIYKRGLLRYLALYPSRQEHTLLYKLINNTALILYIGLTVWGSIRNLKKHGIQYHDLYIFAYLALILLYPFAQSSRYLLPVIPLLSIYTFTGLRAAFGALQKRWKLSRKWVRHSPRTYRLRFFIPAAVYLPLFLAYWSYYILYPVSPEANILLDPDVRTLFQTVRSKRQEISGVVFSHPRVLTLFTDVRAAVCANTRTKRWDLPGLLAFCSENAIGHLIADPHAPGLRVIVTQNPAHFSPIYQNGTYTLYRIIQAPPDFTPRAHRAHPTDPQRAAPVHPEPAASQSFVSRTH